MRKKALNEVEFCIFTVDTTYEIVCKWKIWKNGILWFSKYITGFVHYTLQKAFELIITTSFFSFEVKPLTIWLIPRSLVTSLEMTFHLAATLSGWEEIGSVSIPVSMQDFWNASRDQRRNSPSRSPSSSPSPTCRTRFPLSRVRDVSIHFPNPQKFG